MAHTFDFDAFSQDKLNYAANGFTEAKGGMNKTQLMLALLAVNEFVNQPDIVPPVTSLRSGQMRYRLKALLNILPCDLDGTFSVAGQLPRSGDEQFAIFGVGNLVHSDQI
jgi:hypothetical protein